MFCRASTPTRFPDTGRTTSSPATPRRSPSMGIRMLGLGGDHTAILAKVIYDDASTLANIAPLSRHRGARCGGRENILSSNKEERWVPEEASRHDTDMGEVARRQVHEIMFLGLLHNLERPARMAEAANREMAPHRRQIRGGRQAVPPGASAVRLTQCFDTCQGRD